MITTAERVGALYGRPGLESWRKMGRALGVPPGTAHGLARGLYDAHPDTLRRIELLEWRYEKLPQAVAALSKLIGREPVLPTVFSRAQARAMRRR